MGPGSRNSMVIPAKRMVNRNALFILRCQSAVGLGVEAHAVVGSTCYRVDETVILNEPTVGSESLHFRRNIGRLQEATAVGQTHRDGAACNGLGQLV